ncbi:MAG: hypothetical protein M3389_11080, partial [Actinomycetota bacterium]|nr:hypothetical protein [Actinomycetota bacterium]
MRVEDRTRPARRLLALGGLLMAVAAVVLFVVDPAGDDGPAPDARPGGEAGSKFGERARAERDVTLLDALRP